MKKITATVLSLITLLSIESTSVFALLEDNNELNPQKSVSRKRISEETQNAIKKECANMRNQHPELTQRKIYKIVSEAFNVSFSTVQRYESSEDYRKYYNQNKKKIKKYNREYKEKNQEKIQLYNRQYYKNNKEKRQKKLKKGEELVSDKIETLERSVSSNSTWDDFFMFEY